MEYVDRGVGTRRLFERRQGTIMHPLHERRIAERRLGIDRRESATLLSDWLRWRLFSLPVSFPTFSKSIRKSNTPPVPAWLPLSFFALAFILLVSKFNVTPLPDTLSSWSASSPAVSSPVTGANADREIIIMDPSDTLTLTLVGEGYQVRETENMQDLGIVVQRLEIPAGISISDALADLHNRYPNYDIDVNQALGLYK